MKKLTLFGLASIAMATNPALAQPAASPPASMNQPSSAAGAGATVNPAGGIRKATTATMAVRFMAIQSVDLMATKLIGTKVYNNQNESLGEIEDLVLDNGKSVSGVVVSVGGFLGIGEHYVLIDPSTLVVQVTDGTMKAYIDTSKDNLKSAPNFKYAKKQASAAGPAAAMASYSYSAPLKASSEVPPNDSKGTGSVDAKLDPSSKMLT